MQWQDRQQCAEQQCRNQRQTLATVGRQDEKDRFLEIVEDRAAFLDGSLDAGKVIVQDDLSTR